MAKRDLEKMFKPGLTFFLQSMHVMTAIIDNKIPSLHQMLNKQRIETHMFASSWTMTVFSTFKTFSWNTVCTIWDMFLADGWLSFFQFVTGLLLNQHMRLVGHEEVSILRPHCVSFVFPNKAPQ